MFLNYFLYFKVTLALLQLDVQFYCLSFNHNRKYLKDVSVSKNSFIQVKFFEINIKHVIHDRLKQSENLSYNIPFFDQSLRIQKDFYKMILT